MNISVAPLTSLGTERLSSKAIVPGDRISFVTEKGVSVTKLIQRTLEELVRRNFAESNMRTYLQVVEDFRRYLPTRLDQRGPDDIRR